MKSYVSILGFLIAVGLIVTGCRQSDEELKKQLNDEYAQVLNTYYDGDREAAQSALAGWIATLEKAERTDRSRWPFDIPGTIGLSWLQLSTTYEAQSQLAQNAIDNAIRYFDQNPTTREDKAYQQDKRGSLIRMLDESEKSRRPRWK